MKLLPSRALLAYLALLTAMAAPAFLLASRWSAASGHLPAGDDTPFILMLAAPVSVLVGTVLSLVARLHVGGAPRLAKVALVLNAGMLAGFVAVSVFAAASYQGR